MAKSVYLDSTVSSFYYDEREGSRYRRQISVDWWDTQRRHYDLYTSFLVLQEVANPVYTGWEKVAALAEQVPLLEAAPEIRGIVKVYLENKPMPAGDAGDAVHLALASYHSMDYLLTRNCLHLANANKVEHIRRINMRLGLLTPNLITPEQLFVEE
jgi:predicted nucleic acid-binding protein